MTEFQGHRQDSQYSDLDYYLQREIEKLQDEENRECEEKNNVNIRDKTKVISIPISTQPAIHEGKGHESHVNIANVKANGKANVKANQKQNPVTGSSQPYKENKKKFTCTFKNCRKNYVKSSHLKVNFNKLYKQLTTFAKKDILQNSKEGNNY